MTPKLEEKIIAVRDWLNQTGWAKRKELPDHMAANIRLESYKSNEQHELYKVFEPSLADLVYSLIKEYEKTIAPMWHHGTKEQNWADSGWLYGGEFYPCLYGTKESNEIRCKLMKEYEVNQ